MMNRIALTIVLIGLTAGAATAQPVPAESAKTAAALQAVEKHWTQAEVHGDVAYVDQLLLPGYRSVSDNGVAHPKSAILASAKANGTSDKMARLVATYMKQHPNGTLITISGDIGVVTFYSLKLGPQKGVMSSDIFTYVDGAWHAVYSAHTQVKS